MSSKISLNSCVIGIDFAKDRLDFFIDSSEEEFYERLKKSSKVSKVTLIACARKLLTILNALVRDKTLWGAKMEIRPI